MKKRRKRWSRIRRIEKRLSRKMGMKDNEVEEEEEDQSAQSFFKPITISICFLGPIQIIIVHLLEVNKIWIEQIYTSSKNHLIIVLIKYYVITAVSRNTHLFTLETKRKGL